VVLQFDSKKSFIPPALQKSTKLFLKVMFPHGNTGRDVFFVEIKQMTD
jgi:hypothetical protein